MSLSSVILTENNLVQNGNFDPSITPAPYNNFSLAINADLSNCQIALQKINLYYSWSNCNSTNYQAATFQFPINGGFTSFTWNLTNGNNYASIAELNNAFQAMMITNGCYLINSAGQNVYYAEIISNPSNYGVMLTLFLCPTSLPAGYSTPSNWIGSYPLVSVTPKITFIDGFNKLIGFPSATLYYAGTSQLSYNSTFTPQLSPVSSILVSCNLVLNKLALNNSSSILTTFTTRGSDYGNIIEVEPSQLTWFDCNSALASNLSIQFYDQDYQPLQAKDFATTIVLLIREKNN